MNHSVPHDLSHDLAHQVAQKAVESYAAQFTKYQPQSSWSGADRCEINFTVNGFKRAGAIDLRPGSIDIDLQVPLLLRLFKTQAIAVIEREIQLWLVKARAGEL